MICSLSTGGCNTVRDFTVTSSSMICSLSTGGFNSVRDFTVISCLLVSV